MLKLRPYQEDNFNQLRSAYAKGSRKVLYQAATGSGKTVVASMVTKLAVERGNRVMPVAHRRELIHQFAEKLAMMEIYAGKVMAGERLQIGRSVQVGSIQTLWARYLKEKKIVLHDPDLIIIDEAHRSLSNTYIKLMDAFPKAWVLGLTATPVRTDGRGLGHIYEEMVQSPSVKELTDMGFLVPVIPYGGSVADLKGIGISGHDYNKEELEERQNTPDLVGDCVQNWLKLASGRPTLVFASGVRHSLALEEAYKEVGIRAMHVDANTHKDDRDTILEKLTNGEIQVVTNCMVYTEGTDCPAISCIQNASPTKNIAKYLQVIGRGMRPDSNKKDCIYLDHSGTTMMHGFVEDPIPWELDTKGKLQVRVAEQREQQLKQFQCVDCGCIWSGKIRCPDCGRRLELKGEMKDCTEADLINLKRAEPKKPKEPVYTKQDKQKFYSELLGYASGLGRKAGKSYQHGWVSHKYRSKFGVWPQGLDEFLSEPTPMTLSWIRSQNIRYAKSQEKALS